MVPLQFGVPGGPELLLIVIVGALALVVPFALAYRVSTDAAERGAGNGAPWAVAVGEPTLLTFFGGRPAPVVYIWDRE